MTTLSRDERQDLCIENWKKSGGKGTILAATGFGKTRIGLKVIKRLFEKKPDAKILVVVPSDYLKGQWTLQLAEWDMLQNVQVLVINTAVKSRGKYDLLVCDEVHEYAAASFSNIFSGSVTYKLLLCLTGTINRLDGKETLIKKFAPVCDDVPLKVCQENNWVAQYVEYKVYLDVDLTQYKALNSKFLHHFSFFNYDFKLAMLCVGTKDKKGTNKARFDYANRLGCTYQEVMLHAVQFASAMRERKEWVWTHPRKVELAKLIIEHRPNNKILTFSQMKATAESIGYGVVMHSSQTKKKKESIMKDFNLAEKGVLNSAKALERGADIKGLSVSITLSFNSSSIAKNQKNGRTIRKEDDKISEIFTFVIRGTMEDQWFTDSAKGLKYEVINEEQLVLLLEGKDYTVKSQGTTFDLSSFTF